MSTPPPFEDRPGGIFIPFDKLLEQMDKKLDSIRDELRAIHDVKLDRTVFDAFVKTYDERHERLIGRVAEVEKPDPVVAELVEDKVSRDAVKAQTRYWMGGAGLVGVLVVVNLIVNAIQILGHHHL